jgi:hypothetical protein
VCTRVVARGLKYDIVEVDGKPALSRYGPVVIKNVNESRSYQFLLPDDQGPEDKPVDELVATYRQLIRGAGVSEDKIATQLLFRVSSQPLPIEFVIYDLDIDGLRDTTPQDATQTRLLYEAVHHAVGNHGRFGCVLPPSADLKANVTMRPETRDRAYKTFDAIWNAKSTRVL